jgi:nickel transport protein
MSNAQVIVYAADNPRDAWLVGETDANGRYSFTVDTSINGPWAVSVRMAGHGELLHFNVTRSGRISIDETTERTPLQTALFAGGVIAVLGGVAWYFSRQRKKVDVAVG